MALRSVPHCSRAYELSGLSMDGFCAQHGVSTARLCQWRRAVRCGRTGCATSGDAEIRA